MARLLVIMYMNHLNLRLLTTSINIGPAMFLSSRYVINPPHDVILENLNIPLEFNVEIIESKKYAGPYLWIFFDHLHD